MSRELRVKSKRFVFYGEPGDYLLSQEIQLTIIGVEVFHCPVRDGKEWFHPAMASGLKTGQFGIIFSTFVTLFTFESL